MPQSHSLIVGSPIGKLQIIADDDAVLEVRFESKIAVEEQSGSRVAENEILRAAKSQLAAYFNGELTEFNLPLRPVGTDFQRKVWQQLTRIPFGTTTSYGAIAALIGSPLASRAVGAANGKNPIPIVIPCHRVIGQNGSLTGFGGGLPIKQKLLEVESQAIQPMLALGSAHVLAEQAN